MTRDLLDLLILAVIAALPITAVLLIGLVFISG